MKTLFDLCSLVRSKNAGPFTLTFDVMFSSPENYARAKAAQAITPGLMSKLYGVMEQDILVVYHDAALAIKVSMPRPIVQCDPGDGDCYGGQQYAPLLTIEID